MTNVELPLVALLGTVAVTDLLAPEPPNETFTSGTKVVFEDEINVNPKLPVPSLASPTLKLSVELKAFPIQMLEVAGPEIVGVWFKSKTLTEDKLKQFPEFGTPSVNSIFRDTSIVEVVEKTTLRRADCMSAAVTVPVRVKTPVELLKRADNPDGMEYPLFMANSSPALKLFTETSAPEIVVPETTTRYLSI